MTDSVSYKFASILDAYNLAMAFKVFMEVLRYRQRPFVCLENDAGPKTTLARKNIEKDIQIFLTWWTEAFPITSDA